MEYVWQQALQHYLNTAKNKDKESWQRDLAQKLITVFRPEKLGRLCRFQQKQRAEITITPLVFERIASELTTAFSFFTTTKEKVKIEQSPSMIYLK